MNAVKASYVALAFTLLSACSGPSADGVWNFDSELTSKEADFPKGVDGKMMLAMVGASIPQIKIENNSWTMTMIAVTVKCTINKINADDGVLCVNVKNEKQSDKLRVELSGSTLKLKMDKKQSIVFSRQK